MNYLDDFVCEITPEEKESLYYEDTNRCICCGEIIPEGTQFCKKCDEESYNEYLQRY